jgi:hypothetical protein
MLRHYLNQIAHNHANVIDFYFFKVIDFVGK